MPPGRSSIGVVAGEAPRSSIRFRPAQAPPSSIDADRIAQIVGDVSRRRRRNAAEAIGRGRGDAAAERGEQRARHRMRRHAQPDAVLAAGDDVGDVRCARKNQRQRPRPELAASFCARLRHRARPVRDLVWIVEMDDHRMVGGSAFGGKDPAHGVGIAGVRAEPVDGFGRERDELAGAQAGDRAGDGGRAIGASMRALIAVSSGTRRTPRRTPRRSAEESFSHSARIRAFRGARLRRAGSAQNGGEERQ